MQNVIERLKLRWGITSTFQIFIIMVVFSVTGFSALYARKLIFPLLGISDADPFWYRTLIWLVTIFPIYNILLLTYGALFGQWNFFWGFVKKTMGRFRRSEKPS